MANKFVSSIGAPKKRTGSNVAYTNNGALTNATSGSAVVDFFFLAGSSRGKDITKQFDAAYAENPDLATRIVAWLRDCRGGAGERQTYRNMLLHIEKNYPDLVPAYIAKTAELGRWDDMLIFRTENARNRAFTVIGEALYSKDNYRLAAKWMPVKGDLSVKLREFFGMTPKGWRKFIVQRRQTVEQLMCSGQWNAINFEHVPSTAFARYKNAFRKHTPEKFETLVKKVEAGEAKINSSVVYPYDIIRSMRNSYDSVAIRAAEAQWKALPDYIKEDASFIPVVDVSGSMASVNVSGSVTALDVAVSLGLYLSERNKSAFKDVFVTFSSSPVLEHVSGKLSERMKSMINSHWQMSTDLQAAFRAILDHAIRYGVPASDMPKTIVVLSDMEFNSSYVGKVPATNYESIRRQYRDRDYEMPNLVFWNLNGRAGNNPVTIHDENTALVSGFSPSIMGQVLGKHISPLQVVVDTVGKDKYQILAA